MKLFGTDGIRGEFNKSFISADTLPDIMRAFLLLVKNSQNKKILIGMDTRVSSVQILNILSNVIVQQGFSAINLGVVTTPAVSFLCKQEGLWGIMISASHNVYSDNGLKIFQPSGEKINEKQEEEIENHFFSKATFLWQGALGNLEDGKDLKNKYITFVVDKFKPYVNANSKKIVVDLANGAGCGLVKDIFNNLKLDNTIFIHDKPNGKNINADCGATNVLSLQNTVIENNADIGVALDGDGDRLIIVDEQGNIKDGDVITTFIALNGNISRVVMTILTNQGIAEYLNSKGIELVRVKVGDKYVAEKMKQEKIAIGGEQSGHVILQDIIGTGDGIIVFLEFLKYLKNTQASEILSDCKMYFQITKNISVKEKLIIETEKFKNFLEDIIKKNERARVIVRPSGTEQVIRLFVESLDKELAEEVLKILNKFFK